MRTARPLVLLTILLAIGFVVPVAIRSQVPLGALPEVIPSPARNPTTREKVALGKLLFWDPILSGSGDVACATCHHPDFGYADGRDVSIGTTGIGIGAARHFRDGGAMPFVKRNSPTILNGGFNGLGLIGVPPPYDAPMFWDSRVGSLEAQALEPLKAFEEMRGAAYPEDRALAEAAARVAGIEEYRALFARAFGATAPIDAAQIARAIAAFERTLVGGNSPFDRFVRGDATALTPLQRRGFDSFIGNGCANCHSGPMFSDYLPHVLGVPDNPKIGGTDSGVRGTYAFRTPSLRNVARTAPYMHNGVLKTLEDVLSFYFQIRIGGGPRNAHVRLDELDPLLATVNVNTGRMEFLAFLNALTDEGFDRTIPERVPSGLKVGGAID